MRILIKGSNNIGEYLLKPFDLGSLRSLQPLFQVIRRGRAAPPIGGRKGGDVFVLLLKNILTFVPFSATR